MAEPTTAPKENKVVYGLENVHYAIVDETGATPTFGEPVRMIGGIELSLEPKDESITLAADNDANFYSETENQGYDGTLTISNIPNQFRQDILGEELDTNGVLIEYADAKYKKFALMFEFKGDVTKTRHLMYYCSATRPKQSGKTGKEAEGKELAFTASQLVLTDGGRPYVKAQSTTEDGVYTTWFDEVYVGKPLTPSTVAVTGVTTAPTELSVAVGATATFTYTVAPDNATNKAVTVASADATTATATDASGTVTVTGVKAGTANVTATSVDGAKVGTVAVTVTAAE